MHRPQPQRKEIKQDEILQRRLLFKSSLFSFLALILLLLLLASRFERSEVLKDHIGGVALIVIFLLYPYAARKHLTSERVLDFVGFGVVLVITFIWVFVRQSQLSPNWKERRQETNLTLMESVNFSWFRGSLPVIIMCVCEKKVAIFYNVILLVFVGIVSIITPIEVTYGIVFDQILLIGCVYLHRKFNSDSINLVHEARKVAEKANETKTVFMSKMSHDLRTPLNGLTGFLSELLESELSKEQKETLGVIQMCANDLERLIVDLLNVSLIEKGKINLASTKFPLLQDMKLMGTLMKETAKKAGKELIFFIDKNLPEYAIGDSVRLQQVLTNLINNGLKFTGKVGGKVEISIITEESPDPTITPLHFRVKDNGIGIPENSLEDIFDSFYQCKSDEIFHGSGLGLFICRQVITAMKGTIKVRSKVGEGTTFEGFVPLGRADDKTTPKEDKFKKLSWKGRVLIVEDNPINMRLLAHLLDTMGISHIQACDGIQALEIYRKHRGELQLILTDIQMPKMSGIELIRRIRKFEKKRKQKRKPIIAVTAGVTDCELEELKLVGCCDFLAKPIKKQELYQMLSKVPQ